ncbi:MAG: hypothetical protein ACOCRO_03665 [Halanaerobiales bacterium]
MNIISRKKVSTILIFILTIIYIAPISADVIPLEELQEAEELLYGSSSDVAIIKKVDKLEYGLFGHKSKGTLVDRAWKIINYLNSNDNGLPLPVLVNAMEWTLYNKHKQGALIDRIEGLERSILASRKDGALIERVEYLASLLLSKDSVALKNISLNSGQEINIRLLDDISTASNKTGDIIDFLVENSLWVDNYLIIPSGIKGSIKLTEIQNADNFGKDASLSLSINDITAIDGRKVPLALVANDEGSYSTEIAVGVSLLSTIIVSNPIGLVAGYFYTGKDIELAAGSVIQIQVREDVEIRGLKF